MKKIFFHLLIIITLLSCETKNTIEPNSDFEVEPMLKNWADNIIIPRYQEFIAKVETLDKAVETFTKNPSESTLKTTREAYRTAYLGFQKVSMFEVGKTMETKYRSYINTYPVDKGKLIGKIEAKNTDLTSESDRSKQGFPAIDYLLNGLANTDEAITQIYLDTDKGSAYQEYLKSLTSRIKTLSSGVLQYWQNDYRDTFVKNTKDDVTGSVNIMGNAFIEYFEKYLRAAKIAIPLGLLSNGALPDRVEARYDATLPKVLLKEAVQRVKEFFNGKGGSSFKQYLDALKTNKKNDTSLLSDAINARFDEATKAIDALDDNFVGQISSDKDKLQKVYDALQQNVILLKIDMTQALSIIIDYRDADGD